MKYSLVISMFFFCFICALPFTETQAQSDKKKLSPAATVTGKIGDAAITISYSSPRVKGRKIWGDLVPYNRVWRAGADEATTFTSDKDLVVQGAVLPAGTYSLFAIPGDDEWVMIFNNVAKQWGAYEYKKEQDALRVIVCSFSTPELVENLTYTINPGGFSLQWANIRIPVLVTVSEPKKNSAGF